MPLNIRPAGYSDSDTDSDDGFCEEPVRKYYKPQYEVNSWKKVELDLQSAIINDNVYEVKRIIAEELNENVDTKLESGWTPMMHACFHGQEIVVRYLLENNANPNLHSESVTPIMVACSNSTAKDEEIENIVDLLIAEGAFLNIGDKHGQTPLMRAIISGRVPIVEKFMKKDVNIEMRDGQGWTAVFWAVHNNRADILEILIENGARLGEIDKYNRTALEVAQSHDFETIIEILNEHIEEEVEKEILPNHLTTNKLLSWHYFYPGVKDNKKPSYSTEIPHLLYGMNCEHLTGIFIDEDMDLRSFLLLQETDMKKLGIDLPYEKQRLKNGLRNFHLLKWKLNSVSGLYARQSDKYSVVDCLTTLGNHLQQIYILEASLQYACRNYKLCKEQLKFEPPDSPNIIKIKEQVIKLRASINDIRQELTAMNNIFTKMSKNNAPPADLIRRTSKSTVGTTIKVVAAVTVGLLVYHSRFIISNMIKK